MTHRIRTVLAATAVGLAALAVPASAATTVQAPVEAETMSTVAGRATVFADAAASAGRGRVMVTNGTTSTVLRTATTANRLLLRLRGDQAGGAPRAVVVVDGRQVADLSVANRTWSEFSVVGRWLTGAHTVQVRFVNDARSATADRNLRLDRLRFATVTAPALDDAYEARVVQLVNAARSSRGLRPLAVSACADRYAEAWTTRLTQIATLEHRGDLGAVLGGCGATEVAENIAYGHVTADQLVQMWMDSPGHRENILNAAYTHVGTGAVKTADGTVWSTQNFLRVG
ncbi:MAG: hypothetical protein JWO60_3250 [Frankiales bacterium]|nr:hypothetical protein [Frankiales bacterium]